MPTRATFPLRALLAGALFATTARAEPAGVSLHAPETCGSVQGLEQRIAELVGEQRELDADVTVSMEGGDYRLTVTLPEEQRELRDADCKALLEAAAVMIALAVRTPPAEAPQAREITPDVESISERDTPPKSSAPITRRVHGQGWLELAATYGMLPLPAGALGAGASLRAGVVGMRLGAHYLTPSETAGSPAVRVQGARAALLFTVQPLARLEVGLGAQADFLHGRGTHVDHVYTAWLVAWSAVLEARAALLRQPQDQLGIAAGAGLALQRPDFEVSGHGSVHQPQAWQASLGLFWARDFF